ncbi:MAG: hypothetical protein HUJ63_13145 [Enterococcus sp.]|nr:hypothetical protein [Enterococcus sp.]
MSMDLTGITNQNEYYTNHYFSSIFEENASETISAWRTEAKGSDEIKTPWAMLRESAKQYYPLHDRYIRSRFDVQTLINIQVLADEYMKSLGYPSAKPEELTVDDTLTAPVYLEVVKANGAPLLWVILAATSDPDMGILESNAIFTQKAQDGEPTSSVTKEMLTDVSNEDLATKILFSMNEPPRFIIFIGMNQIALIDRNKWNEKRYLQFELEDIFSRREDTTLQAMAVLMHKDSLCPNEGTALLDDLDANSQKHAAGVSQDLKYALRESIELLGNEVLHDMKHRQGIDFNNNPVNAGELTVECLRYMYRMLFVLFIESRPELGYAPIKAQSYLTGYSLESLRDIADNIRDDVDEVGDGYYLHETLAKLYEMIYTGYPEAEEDILKYSAEESLHDMFVITPLKAHIFDPEYTKLITNAKIRNCVMLRIVDLMSLTRASGRRNDRRGRISYANLGINQLGAVYEALLSYRGFIAEEDLYEVKRAGDKFNELDVGYFVKENELEQYTEDERVRYESGENSGKLRMYKKGSFIYRLAGREREKSASYYTPEVLTKCLVKYALKELLEGKTADDILELTICEPAMGSAAFLNEAINQLAEAYIDKKQKELGETISYEKRFTELQKVKMYLADRNVYGIDLNPVAVELAEVSLWLNTIYEGGYVPWFNTQLVNGNSLIGARRQCYRVEQMQTTVNGLRWYENAPERLPFDAVRADKNYKHGRKQIYHFLLGDPGMCSYSDKVIKSLEPDNIKEMKKWNKEFTKPIDDDDVVTLLRLSNAIDELWKAQINLRKEIESKTQDNLSIYGHNDDSVDSHTTIRQKDKIYSELYKSEHMRNAGPYARLKFAMDYWCALWFWPIDKADLLPSRSEFLFDMSLILEGTLSAVNVRDDIKGGQISMFPSEMETMAMDILNTYGTDSVVDIPRLRKENPRLDLAAKIAEQNKFMHWELEFADIFAERGGFDLVLGNPPWIKIEWKIENLLAEFSPLIALRKEGKSKYIEVAAQKNVSVLLNEYSQVAGQLSFVSSTENYSELSGQYGNIYKNFVVQATQILNNKGYYGLIHPEGLYDNPYGEEYRKKLYQRLRYHFEFINEKYLFKDVAHTKRFSVNIAGMKESNQFITITNLFATSTIDECFDQGCANPLLGLKDNNNEWNTIGSPRRKIIVDKETISLFGKVFDGKPSIGARMPEVHADICVDFFRAMGKNNRDVSNLQGFYCTQLMNETSAIKEKLIKLAESEATSFMGDMVYSGPNIWLANPFYKSAKYPCVEKSDYKLMDLGLVNENGVYPKTKYNPTAKCYAVLPTLPNGLKYHEPYKIFARRRLNLSMERTLISTIVPKNTVQIHAVLGVCTDNVIDLVTLAACLNTVIYDFYIKAYGKEDLYENTLANLPLPSPDIDFTPALARVLALNAIGPEFGEIWSKVWNHGFAEQIWTKEDSRLPHGFFNTTKDLKPGYIATNDYVRRQLFVELDAFVAWSLGISVDLLVALYKLQFPVMQQYESDTWYDANGNIVFTNNKGLGAVGFTRAEWENSIKGSAAGKKFYRTIMDDTVPDGPVERTIEYVAPFDRCDREQDYETAWKFFEEKFGK